MNGMLWETSNDEIKQTNMYRLMLLVNERFGQSFNDYEALY